MVSLKRADVRETCRERKGLGRNGERGPMAQAARPPIQDRLGNRGEWSKDSSPSNDKASARLLTEGLLAEDRRGVRGGNDTFLWIERVDRALDVTSSDSFHRSDMITIVSGTD